jgi:glycosyltransferase involved in cell wall biosynthesis
VRDPCTARATGVEELAYLYRRARMLVFPALRGLRHPDVEAMAAGCPVVAAEATSILRSRGGRAVRSRSPSAIAAAIERV